MGGHFEFLRPVDLDSYRVELPHLILVGFIAFREIECTPLKHAPEKHHIPKDMSTMQAREEALAA